MCIFLIMRLILPPPKKSLKNTPIPSKKVEHRTKPSISIKKKKKKKKKKKYFLFLLKKKETLKGVSKVVVKEDITHNDYVQVLETNKPI